MRGGWKGRLECVYLSVLSRGQIQEDVWDNMKLNSVSELACLFMILYHELDNIGGRKVLLHKMR